MRVKTAAEKAAHIEKTKTLLKSLQNTTMVEGPTPAFGEKGTSLFTRIVANSRQRAYENLKSTGKAAEAAARFPEIAGLVGRETE